jgi:GDPmannose 4,6-dehydratase
MWLMLQQEKPDDFVIATGETHSVRDFLDVAFGLLDLDWQDYVVTDPRYFRASEVNILKGDYSKAAQQLKWQPRIDFRELVRIMVYSDLQLAEQEVRMAGSDSDTGVVQIVTETEPELQDVNER